MIDIPNSLLIKLTKILILILLVIGLSYIFLQGFNIALNILLPWFMPFILAFIIALLIDPVVSWFQNRLKLSRTLATTISLISFFSVMGIILFFLFFYVVVEIIDLSSNLPEYFKILRTVIEDAVAQAQYFQYLYLVDISPDLLNDLTYNVDNISASIRDISNLIINTTIFIVSSLPGILTLFVVAAVATFFLTRDKKELGKTMLTLIPVSLQPKITLVSAKLISALIGFIRAQIILITITGFQTVIGLYIIGVEYALTVGILVGLVDILPIIGPGIIFIPWAIVLFILGNSGFAFALLFLYGMIIIVRSLLEPKIVADNIGLHPLTTLVSIYVGLRALGLIGIIIGPTVVIIIKACVQTEFKKI